MILKYKYKIDLKMSPEHIINNYNINNIYFLITIY